MMYERAIIHLNVADFAVAVERVVDRRLQNRPVIIAPDAAVRAVVYDMSDEAYLSGVRKGMALPRAMRYCRDAAVLPPHTDRYERAMRAIFKHALPYSPLIEVTDHNGHLFIDASSTKRLFGPPPDIAYRIRKSIRADLNFDPIWSVAPNKLVAKVATRMVKPTGEYIVSPGEEEAFLKPLPIHFIPGIEQEDLKRFREFNLSRVDHVTHLSVEQLGVIFGKQNLSLYEAVRGIDPSPVRPVGEKQPVVKTDIAFGNDTNDVAIVEGALYQLIEQAGADLRNRRLAAKRIRITLDYSDGKRMTRQAISNPPTANDIHLFAVAKIALERAWTRRVRIRHLRLICDRLTYPPAQIALFPDDKRREDTDEALIATLDTIRDRFGPHAIRMGRALSILQ